MTTLLPIEGGCHRLSRFGQFIRDDYNRVHVTSVISPDEFYCVPQNKISTLVEYTKHFKHIEDNLVSVNCKNLSKGDGVLLQDTDGDWYRSRITYVDSSKQEVQGNFMDTGKQDVVVPFEKVRQIPDSHMASPPMAVGCALINCHPIGGTWTEEAINFFKDTCKKRVFALHMVESRCLMVYGDLLNIDPSRCTSVRDSLVIQKHASLTAVEDDNADTVVEGHHYWCEVETDG